MKLYMVVLVQFILPSLVYAGDYAASEKYYNNCVTRQTGNISNTDSICAYEMEYRNNRKAIKDAVKNYSISVARKMGMSDSASKITISAAALTASFAANKSLKLRLNEAKTLRVVMKNPIGSDRSLFLNYRIRW